MVYGPEGGLTRNCSCSVLGQAPDHFYKEFVLYGDHNIARLGPRPVGHAHSQTDPWGERTYRIKIGLAV